MFRYKTQASLFFFIVAMELWHNQKLKNDKTTMFKNGNHCVQVSKLVIYVVLRDERNDMTYFATIVFLKACHYGVETVMM